ncbi:hypothetical protein ACUNWD_14760 [Sunxiuqinia sp. A32]|uniref:hypothetical protein n=1 Tax=Sunxiuqinia sp. A32 TaxID=3461496 RepID=UPI004045A823
MKYFKTGLISIFEGTSVDERMEEDANQFTRKYLFPHEAFDQLSYLFEIDEDAIVEFSHEFSTHLAIIVGQLQFAKKIS